MLMSKLYNRDETSNGERKSWIRQSFLSRKVGVLVSDMSSFTKLTRTYGIIHFASIILRMRQLCYPIFRHYEALSITTEADNFIVIFPSAAAAVKAALGIQQIAKNYNASLPDDKAHFAVTMNGVGVDYGDGPLLDSHGRLYGKTFSNAYAMGEELCDKGCVLITGNVISELKADSSFLKASYIRQMYGDDDDASAIAATAGGLHIVHMEELEDFVIPSPTDSSHLPEILIPLTQRHSSASTLQQSASESEMCLDTLDKRISAEHMCQRTVLMFEFDHEVEDAATQIHLEVQCLAHLKQVFDRHRACMMEPIMYMFADPVDAVSAALEVREEIKRWSDGLSSNSQPSVSIRGYGIHTGEVLIFPGTDVHWGDPVNTSSKLGQDIARDGHILVSDTVYTMVEEDGRMAGVVFTSKTMRKSGVDFIYYSVHKGEKESQAQELAVETKKWSTPWDTVKPFMDRIFCGCSSASGSVETTHDMPITADTGSEAWGCTFKEVRVCNSISLAL